MQKNIYNTYTNTKPAILHNTTFSSLRNVEDKHSIFLKQFNYYKNINYNFNNTKELSMITYSNFEKKTLLEKHCDNTGINLKVYGKNIDDWVSNYNSKIKLIYEACRKEESKYILGLDSDDVIIIDSPKNILSKFKKMNTKLLFGSEVAMTKNRRKISDLYNYYISKCPSNSLFPFLNSGMWIGERKYALSFFKKVLEYPPREEDPKSDQLVIATVIKDKDLIGEIDLDYNCDIFQNLTSLLPEKFISEEMNSANKNLLKISLKFNIFRYNFKSSIIVLLKNYMPKLYSMLKNKKI